MSLSNYERVVNEFNEQDCSREARMLRDVIKRPELLPAVNGASIMHMHESLVLVRRRQLELATTASDAISIELQKKQLELEEARATTHE